MQDQILSAQLFIAYVLKKEIMLAYTCVHMPFTDPDNTFQNFREYIGLLVSLLLVQTYKHNNNLHTEHTHVEWYGDNSSAISWAV